MASEAGAWEAGAVEGHALMTQRRRDQPSRVASEVGAARSPLGKRRGSPRRRPASAPMPDGVRRERAGPRRAQRSKARAPSPGAAPGVLPSGTDAGGFPAPAAQPGAAARLRAERCRGVPRPCGAAARLRAELAQSRDTSVTNPCAFLGYPPPGGGWGAGCPSCSWCGQLVRGGQLRRLGLPGHRSDTRYVTKRLPARPVGHDDGREPCRDPPVSPAASASWSRPPT